MSNYFQFNKGLACFAILILFLNACTGGGTGLRPTLTPPTPAPVVQTNPVDSPTPPVVTVATPTSTPLPLAALVNGTKISLVQYEAELARYQASTGTELALQDRKRVLDDLINQVLLEQGAAEKGFMVDQKTLEDRLDQLASKLGGMQALDDWIAANGYTPKSFRVDLSRSIAVAWMRDQIAASVSQTAEQIHARQILVYYPEQASDVLFQLKSGEDFASLAAKYDPVTRGDLGWFPRGYLTDPKLEEAAFNLEVGSYSDVIETQTGFYIIQVIERDPQRSLEPDARMALQYQMLQSWLEARRQQSEIQTYTP